MLVSPGPQTLLADTISKGKEDPPVCVCGQETNILY